MDDVRILKAAYHVNDRIDLTDIGKELVSKALTLGSTLYQTCDINELDHSRGYLFGMVQVSQ